MRTDKTDFEIYEQFTIVNPINRSGLDLFSLKFFTLDLRIEMN